MLKDSFEGIKRSYYIKPIYDPIYLLLGTNVRWNTLSCHGYSYGIIWQIVYDKIFSFGGIHLSTPYQDE